MSVTGIDTIAAAAVIRAAVISRADGDGGTRTNAYSSASSSLDVGIELLPHPSLAWEMEANKGGAETWRGRMWMRADAQPWADALAGIPQPEISVTLIEFIPDVDFKILFQGTVANVVENPDGQPDLVRLDLEGLLAPANSSLGVMVTRRCVWQFGGPGCDKDLGPLKKTVAIATIDGYQVTVDGLDPTDEAGYWKEGSLVIAGAPVKIRGYTTGSGLTLSRRLPDALLEASAVAVPGCDGRKATCQFWGNEERFCGLGIKMTGRDASFQES